jgi:hypothetical protein
MEQYISVTMPLGSFHMGYFNASQPQIPVFNELMKIYAKTNPERHIRYFYKCTQKKTALRPFKKIM